MVRRPIDAGTLLAALPRFKELNTPTLERLAAGVDRRALARGELRFAPGGHPDRHVCRRRRWDQVGRVRRRARRTPDAEASVRRSCSSSDRPSSMRWQPTTPWCCITPEHLSRLLHELEADGLLPVESRRIVVPDTQRLAGAALHQPSGGNLTSLRRNVEGT